MCKVIQGDRPDRPSPGFSDTLWELLVRTWDTENGPETRIRPSASIIRDRLRRMLMSGGGQLSRYPQNGGKKAVRILGSERML